MLELAQVDLVDLSHALRDHSPDQQWWFDPQTGRVEPWSSWMDGDADEGHPDDRGLLPVESIGSHEAYGDMEDFVASIPDPRARDPLERAITGRGAFRRFEDTLFEFPELRSAWFALSNARMERRALRWLADHEIVDEAQVERAAAERPDPAPLRPPGTAVVHALAAAVARDLRDLYGGRLLRVLLFGSGARRETHPESDLDLLVVLEDMRSSWEERQRMDEVLWRHSLQGGTVVCALPVRARDTDAPSRPVLLRALEEGVDVG